MKLPPPFFSLGDHIAIDLPGARAAFTTRRGGYSEGPYQSLNLGRFTEDRRDLVERNRQALEEQLGVRFAYGRQVHGALVQRVTRATAAPDDADGQATAQAGVAPMVLVADCLPVAVAGEGAVAMIHCGWRGLAAGIVAEGVRAVRELGAQGPLAAAIGPGVGVCCYEVGQELHDAFGWLSGDGFRRGANLDLKAIARAELAGAGVDLVHDVGLCTMCAEASIFYSHRRDRGVTGRQAGVAWLT